MGSNSKLIDARNVLGNATGQAGCSATLQAAPIAMYSPPGTAAAANSDGVGVRRLFGACRLRSPTHETDRYPSASSTIHALAACPRGSCTKTLSSAQACTANTFRVTVTEICSKHWRALRPSRLFP